MKFDMKICQENVHVSRKAFWKDCWWLQMKIFETFEVLKVFYLKNDLIFRGEVYIFNEKGLKLPR